MGDDEVSLGPAFLEACGAGRTDVVKSLLEDHNFDVNSVIGDEQAGNVGTTGMHIACNLGHQDCVRALFKAGARVDIKDSNGKVALDVATNEIRNVFQQELLQRVMTGDLQGVKDLIAGGVDVDVGDGTKDDSSILHWAASFGQDHSMLEVLVAAGANVNKKNSSGRTPLHEACENNHVDSVHALIKLGSNRSILDENNCAPLDVAPNKDMVGHLFTDEQNQEQGNNQEQRNDADVGEEQIVVDTGEHPEVEEVGSVAGKRTDVSEVLELRRMNEEKDMMIITLRETVEMLLSDNRDNGVLKYIHKLQDEFRKVNAQLQRVEDHKEHLQSMYIKCDTELERVLRDNAMLRSALHEKEQRVLELLEEEKPASATKIVDQKENGEEKQTANLLNQRRESKLNERNDSIEMILLERDRLAQDLESERRLRFTEARLHLGYASQLREQLQTAQEALVNLQRSDAAGNGKVGDGELTDDHQATRGVFSSIFHTIFGEEDEEDEYESDSSVDA
uniref:Uncharacterized protein n=1 Tax=Mucochytrium quahogii TaxID=96639 RepID=A0A7S2WP25_9STRA|mmetsp:Transcript_43742/g.69995  ORF Transcript_43742/g.69995 Transcript_43742/m.69995 type:complete len:507 (+) Transcript_43742:1570-3090(+)|eukprot:CAMPEP_0203751990 /NCGR_PEP_ID=MMETSP0098-20131031/5979_1 /ASSEMBLY_ACC=CAM_ASM_000208 /TAXON_ID=96639 /ORGANISM=" , Strain NY0313808BC1" /LENGTH=506 /DNA_ID=CAMNT_0050641967 /DNA_START=325 /DNA_END=1845 /DNA_ORIENTATION=+